MVPRLRATFHPTQTLDMSAWETEEEWQLKATDIRQSWTQEGTFADSEGAQVRCYDDVVLLEATSSEPDNNGSVIDLSAGTSGTVLFFSTGEPCWLELEFEAPGDRLRIRRGVQDQARPSQ